MTHHGILLTNPLAPPATVGSLSNQSFDENSGTQTYATSGGFSGTGITYSLTTSTTGVSINSSSGLVSVNTATTGMLTASTVTVRATNAAGTADQSFALTVLVWSISNYTSVASETYLGVAGKLYEFQSSTTAVVTSNVTVTGCRVAVVPPGGSGCRGGGGIAGGGGSAGNPNGVRTGISLANASSNVLVVGTGGASQTSDDVDGNDGSAVTTGFGQTSGGVGQGGDNHAGQAGDLGSGGAGRDTGGPFAGGTGSVYNGGTGHDDATAGDRSAGGGAGAGAVGGNASTTTGGIGGTGIDIGITDTAHYCSAGGGGGVVSNSGTLGTAGAHGGGTGGRSNLAATAGTTPGSGGGGGGGAQNSGAGFRGVVWLWVHDARN